ncbi:hypothetical protein ACFT7U_10985 [Streptomyces rochei]|uniref:hypothetical protein n=1 Tax=Streptomyces rochei TaxID=1928 RepID=UPI003635C682
MAPAEQTETDAWDTARTQVLAAVARQADGAGAVLEPAAAAALEHLARAVAALTPHRNAPHTDTLQLLPPTAEERTAGHKLGIALELEQ